MSSFLYGLAGGVLGMALWFWQIHPALSKLADKVLLDTPAIEKQIHHSYDSLEKDSESKGNKLKKAA